MLPLSGSFGLLEAAKVRISERIPEKENEKQRRHVSP